VSVSAIRRTEAWSCGRPTQRRRRARVLGLLVAFGACLLFAPAALARPSLTWSGRAPLEEEEWSAAANWNGGVAPAPSEEIETLRFPRLTNAPCTSTPPSDTCYLSFNDVSGLSARSVQIDDGDDYLIEGEELGLGSGGLSAAPAVGTSGPAEDLVELPLHLLADQRWSVAGRSSGELGEDGLRLEGEVEAAGHALTVELSSRAALVLDNDTEGGPVTIEGASAVGPVSENGFVDLLDGEIDALTLQPVTLRHILFTGSGEVGALSTTDVQLEVGHASTPAEGLEATSVKLDAGTEVAFRITGDEPAPTRGYSQLTSEGTVDLAGATLAVDVAPPAEGAPCPVLARGSTYTFVSTTSTLSGSFANAPEGGPEIPISFDKACTQLPQKMRISYDRSDETETVTGTVEAQAKELQEARERQEAAARREATERQQARESQEATERQQANEREATKSEESAATRKHEEEVAASKALQAQAAPQVTTPLAEPIPAQPPTLTGISLTASVFGTVALKLRCPVAQARCIGTMTLRTLHPVSVGATGTHGKAKAGVLTLAAGSFAIAAGQSRLLVVHLSEKARRLLARSHILSVRVTLVARDPSGATHTRQTTASLRAGKANHKG
jgi:hypothetical protein